MNNKTKRILKWTPSFVLTLILAMSATFKLTAQQPIVEHYTELGMQQYLNFLGIAELFFVTLFMLPRTMKIGFLLLTAYFGGAVAVEVAHQGFFIAPLIILMFIWTSAYVRKPEIFGKETRQTGEGYPYMSL